MPKLKKLAVIGDPIRHSLSPFMHNAVIRKLKLPFRYHAIRVKPEQLKSFLKTKAPKLLGFNITIPHKESIIPYLDRLSYEAKLIGAVNTVLCKDGKLIGFNTDGAGYLLSLHAQADFNPRNKNVVILGAGGAARALATALALAHVASICIANRHPKRADQLVKELGTKLPQVKWSSSALEGKSFEASLKRCHLLINSTRIGMDNSSFDVFPWKKLKSKALVSDIVYTPRMTPFLKSAKKLGHPILTGEGMLVQQGALAFEIWTATKADTRLMRSELLKKLKAGKTNKKI